MLARRAALRCADHRSILLRAAALTHKIKRSHCYFSPAVVIRLQCGSIRDCTAPRSPSTLRLGGQQWRRREKRRKRQRRRRRSVGRRSSQSRTDLRHLMCRRSRHTEPANVEVIEATAGRLRWRRGAPAGCGCELRNSGSLSATAKGGEPEFILRWLVWSAVPLLKPSRRSPRCVGSILPKLTSASSVATPIFYFCSPLVTMRH